MDTISAWINWFTGNQWVSFVALVVAIIALIYAAVPVHNARKQRRLETARNEPGVKAAVNRSPSVDGWRSMNLHITPPPAQADKFRFTKNGWRILNAKLISPRSAKLAFAREDDHSLRGPIVGLSPRIMSGRIKHPQPFALEFFIKFPETPHADRGKRAKFRIKLGHGEHELLRRTLYAWAEVPFDAETQQTEQA